MKKKVNKNQRLKKILETLCGDFVVLFNNNMGEIQLKKVIIKAHKEILALIRGGE